MKSKAFVLAVILLGIACSQSPEAKAPAEDAGKELDEYKASPLATLMRKMDADLQVTRSALMNGTAIPDSIDFNYGALLTAEPTDPEVRGELFDNMAKAFLFSIGDLKNASPEEQHKVFNQSVNGCINCHGQLCPGPLVRIRKLPIPGTLN